jgi:hypothetical protein
MKDYTFDMVLKAAVTVEAESEEEARRIVEGVLDDCATAQFFEGDRKCPEDTLEGEVSLMQPPTLGMIDGEDVE